VRVMKVTTEDFLRALRNVTKLTTSTGWMKGRVLLQPAVSSGNTVLSIYSGDGVVLAKEEISAEYSELSGGGFEIELSTVKTILSEFSKIDTPPEVVDIGFYLGGKFDKFSGTVTIPDSFDFTDPEHDDSAKVPLAEFECSTGVIDWGLVKELLAEINTPRASSSVFATDTNIRQPRLAKLRLLESAGDVEYPISLTIDNGSLWWKLGPSIYGVFGQIDPDKIPPEGQW